MHCVWRDLAFLSLHSCQCSGEHSLDVVAFRIVHESGVVGRAVVRARAGFAVTGASIGKTGLIERLHGIIVGSLKRHMNRRDGIALGCSAHPHGGTILGHKA